MNSPMFFVVDADDMDGLAGAVKDAAEVFADDTKTQPTHVWLHPDWKSLIDEENFYFDTTLTPIYDGSKKQKGHVEVGKLNKEKVVKRANGKAVQLPPHRDNFWQGFQTDDPGEGNMIAAIQEYAAIFVEKVGIEPTHVALHSSFTGKEKVVEEETGLSLVFDPPMPYPTQGFVGIREVVKETLKIVSTNVKEVAYYPNHEGNTELGTLLVKYKRRKKKDGTSQSDSAYQYESIPASVYKDLLMAKSKGAFINKHIRPKKDEYPVTKFM